MPLNERLADADDDEAALYGILVALMLLLPDAVSSTLPADVLRNNGYCHKAALHTLRLNDLEEMGVLRGHARMLMAVLRPGGDPPPTPTRPANTTSTDAPKPSGRYMRCRSFPECSSGGAPARRAWRAFIMAFVVVLRTIGVPFPVPDVVLTAGLSPNNARAPVDADVAGLVWDALLSVEGGLPDDILLSIPESTMLARDGIMAVAHIGARVMTTSDQSVAALSSWYNEPVPITKAQMVSNALVEWLRATEQLTAEGAAPSLIQQRISLQQLMSRIPEVLRAFEALEAICDDVDIADMIKAARRIGNKHTSVQSQKRAIAMMVGSNSVTQHNDEENENSSAMAAPAHKRKKVGRCKFHDGGKCKYGEKCRFNHVGSAGNGHPPPPGHAPYYAPGSQPPVVGSQSEGEDVAVANLASMVARMLSGIASQAQCSVAAVSELLVSKLQRRRMMSAAKRSKDVPGEISSALGANGCDNVVPKQESNDNASALITVPVVCDTAATMPVVGADLAGAVGSLKKAKVSVSLDTANGLRHITEAVDVPNAKGLMDRSLVVDGCSRSLCPVVSVCESKQLGFEIDAGATGARFLSGSQTYLELDREGDFFTFDVEVDSGYESCGEGDDGAFLCAEDSDSDDDMWSCVECTPEHADILLAAASSVQSAYVAKFSLDQHCADGHRPYNVKCPWCVSAGMRSKKAISVSHSDRVCDKGYSVSVDFSGPFEPDVDGNTQALVGVEIVTSKGFVGLQHTRSAADTLESLKDFEADLKSCAADSSVGIAEFHHDDDKSFRSHVGDYARDQGWADTHTGGYNPNGNSVAERRIGMLNQAVRTVLLCATGGFKYYDQLWGRALVYSSDVIDWTPFSDRISPLSVLAGRHVDPPDKRHSFGAYCLYRVPREKRKKFEPPSRMGIWVGLSKRVKGGHLIVPIQWCALEQCFRLGATVECITVKVYDNVYPLRMEPPNGEFGSQKFNDFVDSLMEPMQNKHPLTDAAAAADKPKPVDDAVPAADEGYTVEKIKKTRVKHGAVQYLVKWAGYINKHNTWVDIDDMNCDDLIAEFEAASALSAHVKIDPKETLQTDAEVAAQSAKVFGPNDVFAKQACADLIDRQSMAGTVDDYLPGYKKEICNILRRRMTLQDPKQAYSVRSAHALGKLRMLLELKRDGRRKGRLIINKEPVEWQTDSNASPVAYLESIRMMLFMCGCVGDCLSINDISVAFLQADEFPEEDKRYVSYTAYKGAVEHILRLHGCLYGQKCASKQFYCTLATWLCDNGFKQADNEPCLFVNGAGVKVLLWVDDLLVRGLRADTDAFHDALEARFECRDGARQYLSYDHHLEYCGLKMSVTATDAGDLYSMDQSDDVATFLLDFGLDSEPVRTSPMPNLNLLLSDDTVLGPNSANWCKSAIGVLHFLARGTRWDISLAVSMISQLNAVPTKGVEAAIRYLAGYMNATVDHCLSGLRPANGVDVIDSYVDASHHGAKAMHSQSQTGLMVILNKVPLRWRSTRQPDTSDSPAVSELYAIKEIVKDARLQHWVAEEMGLTVTWPFTLKTDSQQCVSFASDSCAKSTMRGSFDWREDWVREVKDKSQVVFEHVAGVLNPADIMTKCLKGPEFRLKRELVMN